MDWNRVKAWVSVIIVCLVGGGINHFFSSFSVTLFVAVIALYRIHYEDFKKLDKESSDDYRL